MLQFFQAVNLVSADTKFSVYDFYYRIKKIEKVCSKEGLDGLLIITGIDGRENSEYTKLLNWMNGGKQGVEIESNEYLDAQLSDMIILITPTGTSIYSDRQGWNAVKHQFQVLPNLTVFVPNEEEDDNKDESELIKVAQFLKMMEPIKKVGVLLGKRDEGKLKNIEKWPLIQAYAIQELGRGFFSMYHQVFDMTARINQLYKVHDRHSLKYLINVIAQRLKGHTNAAVSQISDVKPPKRAAITEEQLSEVFLETFEIEELNKFFKTKTQSELPTKPRILIGKNTSLPIQESSTSNSIEQLSQDGPPLHLTVEAFDLLSSVRCARTYFLSKQTSSEILITPVMSEEDNFIESYAFQRIQNNRYQDERLLMAIYVGLIIGFNDVMTSITKDFRNLTTQFIAQTVFERLKSQPHLKDYPLQTENLKVWVGSINAFGDEVPINFKETIAFKLTPHFFVIRLQYQNVISDDKNLGSVLLADSFILQENCFFTITKPVPYLALFNVQYPQNSTTIETIKKRITMPELGKQLSEPCEKNRIFVPTGAIAALGVEIPIINATYILHELGLRVGTDQLGWTVIMFDSFDLVEIITGPQFDHSWLIFTSKNTLMFETLGCTKVALEFAGQSVQKVLFPLQTILEGMEKQMRNHQNVPKDFLGSKVGSSLVKNPPIRQSIIGNQVVDGSFLLDYLESKQMTILNQMKDLKIMTYRSVQESPQNQSDGKIGLILVTGGLSSGKRRFVQNIAKYASDCKCLVSTIDFGLLEQTALTEQGFIQKLKSSLNMRPQTASQRSFERVGICVVPHFLNIDTIIQQVEQIQGLYLRCVVNRVNANYFYVGDHSQIQRDLISHSLPGYAQIVIVDTFSNIESEVDDLLKCLRQLLPDQQIYRTTNNIVYQNIAQAVFKEKGYSNTLNALLRMKLAILRNVPQEQLELMFVHFKVPFKKEKVRRGFKELLNPPKLSLNLDPKLSNEQQELLRLQEKLKLRPSTEPEVRHVKGYLRYESDLKSGLIELTANKNYVTEREVRNIEVQLKEIDVDGMKVKDANYLGFQQDEDFGFLFQGRNLSREYCMNVLISLCRGPFKPLKYLERKDLSEETLKKISFENRGRLLDPGYFYDGCHFRDDEGQMLPGHPSLDQLVQEFLDKENQLIEEQNQKIKKEWEGYYNAFK